MDLTDIFRTFHPNAEEHTFFSSAHEHFPGQTTSWVINQTSINLGKLKLINYLFQPQHYETKYQLQEKTVKNTNTQRLNNIFLHNEQIAKEIQREIKKFLETNDNEKTTTQNLWDEAKAVLREVYSNTIQSQETRKTMNR